MVEVLANVAQDVWIETETHVDIELEDVLAELAIYEWEDTLSRCLQECGIDSIKDALLGSLDSVDMLYLVEAFTEDMTDDDLEAARLSIDKELIENR